MIVPILVHLLTRRQKKHQRFSAIHLLLQSKNLSTKRSIPNRKFLLFIRCLSVTLLSAILANPIFSFSNSTDFPLSSSSANVFILDDSYSMGTQVNKKSYYARAVEALLDMKQSLPVESVYSVVLGSNPSRVFLGWTDVSSKVKTLLQLNQPSARATEIGSSIALALKLLESVSQKDKRIYILTDRDKNGWNESKLLAIKRKVTYPINIIDFSKMQHGLNKAAIEQVIVRQEFLSNSRVIRIKLKVANLSQSKPLNKLKVSLWVNGKKQARGTLNIPVKSSSEKEFSFPLQENILLNGEVRIEDDALLTDNVRYFNYQPNQTIRTLVVDGDPKTVEHQSETFYVERALNPFSASLSNIKSTLSTLAELPTRNLFDYSVVMLCNVRNLPFGYEQELEKFIMNGGSLFITLGDQIDAKFYNEKLGNILPVYLKTLYQIEKDDKSFLFFAEPSRHPALKVFRGKALEEMKNTRFNSLYSIEPREGSNFTTPMVFENKFPALIESTIGKGKAFLFVSSIDRDWNNFSIQPTFLPWIQRLVKYSARGLDSLIQKDLLVGNPYYLKAQPENLRAYITTPRGKVISLYPKNSKYKFGDTYRPGTYKLHHGPKSSNADGKSATTLSKLPYGTEIIGSFTVNIDSKESSSVKISNEEIKNLLPDSNITFSDGYQESKMNNSGENLPIFTPLLLLAGSILLLEGWLIRKE